MSHCHCISFCFSCILIDEDSFELDVFENEEVLLYSLVSVLEHAFGGWVMGIKQKIL